VLRWVLVKQFEAENQALAEELDSHADAARQLERKMEEISQMVTFFATKVVLLCA